MSTELAPLDRVAFNAAEDVIERGQRTFVEVGNALAAIRDLGLAELRSRGYSTFEDYCDRRWRWSYRRGLQLIRGAAVVNELKTRTEVHVFPESEKEARPLVSLSAAERLDAWQEAVESAPGGQPTTAHVERAAKQRRESAITRQRREEPMSVTHLRRVEPSREERRALEQLLALASLTKLDPIAVANECERDSLRSAVRALDRLRSWIGGVSASIQGRPDYRPDRRTERHG